MNDTLERIGKLYRIGGIKEVCRGIRDRVMLDERFPAYRLYNTRDMSHGGEKIQINIEDPESYWRTSVMGENPMMNDFTSRITPECTVWDIGANIGIYSLLAAEKAARVYAFEPGISAVSQLHQNISLNGSGEYITPVPIALSDINGLFHLSTEGRTGTRTLETVSGDIVPVYRGDEIDIEYPSVIKIDVEGHEKEVIQGLEGILSHVDTIYLEVHEVPKIDLYRVLCPHGFEVTEEWNRADQTHLRLDK